MMPVLKGPLRKRLRKVDIMADPGVWAILDEGCNTTCHSKMWRENAEEKYLQQGFVVERFPSKKEYHGVGGSPIQTKFCFKFPFNISCGPYDTTLAGVLHSQELGHDGFVPLLLSLGNQSTLGLVKDMRTGTCYLKDYDATLELCICEQNGLLCINIGDMSKVLYRRTELPTVVRPLRWGSTEYLEHFSNGTAKCNAMPFGEKDRIAWADLSCEGNVHEGLTQQTCGNETCDAVGTLAQDTNMDTHNTTTHSAAVSSPNENSEDHRLDDPSQALMAEATKPEMWVISLGAQEQEKSQLWNDRGKSGTLKDQQKYCTNAIKRYGLEDHWREGDNAVGDEIIRAVDWHHNTYYNKVVHGLWQGENTHYVVLDCHHMEKTEQYGESLYDPLVIEHLQKDNKLRDRLRGLGRKIGDAIRDRKKSQIPIVIIVADNAGMKVSPLLAEVIWKICDHDQREDRKVRKSHLGLERMNKPDEKDSVGNIDPKWQKKDKKYEQKRHDFEKWVYDNLFYHYKEDVEQAKKHQKKLERGGWKDPERIKNREKDEEFTPRGRTPAHEGGKDKKKRKDREPSESPARPMASTTRKAARFDEDVDRLDSETLLAMKKSIEDRLGRLEREASQSKEVRKKSPDTKEMDKEKERKKKDDDTYRQEKERKRAEKAKKESAAKAEALHTTPQEEADYGDDQQEGDDDVSSSESVDSETRRQIEKDLQSDEEDRERLRLKEAPKAPAESPRGRGRSRTPARGRYGEHGYGHGEYQGWNSDDEDYGYYHGHQHAWYDENQDKGYGKGKERSPGPKGKGKRGKSKDKTPPRYQSSGYWKWEPAPKKTVKEVEDILMRECVKFDAESLVRTKTDWLYVEGLDNTLRYTAKIKPRHTRMPVMSYLKHAKRFSFIKKEGEDQWTVLESNASADMETNFEEEEKVKLCLVFLVPENSIGETESTSFYANFGSFTNDRENGGMYLDQSAAQYYMAAATTGFTGVTNKEHTPNAHVGDSWNVAKSRLTPTLLKLCTLLVVFVGKVQGVQFASNPEGPNFKGNIFKVKDDHGLEKLQAKMMRERTNLIGVISRDATEEDKKRFEELCLTTEGTTEHACFITPQFNFESSALELGEKTRWNGPGDVSIWTDEHEMFSPLQQWASRKNKFHTPKTSDDMSSDPGVAQTLHDVSQKIMDQSMMEVAYPAESQQSRIEEIGTLDFPEEDDSGEPEEATNVADLERAFDEEEQMLDEIPLPDIPAGEASRRQQWLQLSRQTRTAVRKLHRQFGHCPNRVLTEILRASGAPPEYIKASRLVRCQGCEHEQPKPQTSKVSMPRSLQFNESVGLDIFEVKDASGQRYSILSFMCLGTLFHQACVVSTTGGQVSSKLCLEKFMQHWGQIMGLPAEIVTDRGLHNRGEFTRGLSARGVQMRTIGVESPEQLGRVERHGSILKGMIHRTIHELKISGERLVKQVLAESLICKNTNSRVKGFTPAQWVYGKLPRESASIASEDLDIGVLQSAQDGSHEFARQMDIREAARISFIKEDMSKRVARALLRKAAPVLKDYAVGDLVCFKTDQSGWTTACRIIGFEGAKLVWVIHQGMPACVALDRLRPVNASEALAYQHLKDATRLNIAPGRRIGFIDATRPLHSIQEDPEMDADDLQEASDDETPQLEETPFYQRRERLESQATQEEPDQEMIPPSRRRSREERASDAADVPVSMRRRLSERDSRPTESRASESGSVPTESRAEPEVSPLMEAFQRAGETGPGVDLAQEGWNRSHLADTWQVDDKLGLVIREHKTPRTVLFSPSSLEDLPVERSRLSDVRITNVAHPSGKTVTIQDSWTDDQEKNLRKQWVGKTIFVLKSTIEEQVNTKKKVVSFFQDRQPAYDNSKSGKRKAAGKQFNYFREPEWIRKGIDESRRAEWQKWSRFMAVRPIERAEAEALIREGHPAIDTQWIDTDKNLHLKREGHSHEVQFKSRLVERGDQETTEGIRTDSPTAEIEAVNLVISWCASKRLKLQTLDITNAYFHGEKIDRLVLLKQPRGGIPGEPEGQMYVCNTPIYGGKDSGRLFWKRLKSEAKTSGLRASKVSRALFFVCENGEPKVMMASHVDDLIYACLPGYEHIMKNLQKAFQVEDSKISSGEIRFCGREVKQAEDYTITVTCKDTTERLEKISYRNGIKKDSPVTEGERSQLRSVVGGLAWVARQARPDLSYKVSKLQSRCNCATIKDLIYANEAVQEAKDHSEKGLIYKPDAIDWDTAILVTVSDASWSNETDHSRGKVKKFRSQRARMTLLAQPDFWKNQGSSFHVISWQSTIVKRVCRNTLQAETYAMTSAVEEGMRIRAIIADIKGQVPDLRDWENDSRRAMKHVWLTDCKSLEEHLRASSLGKVDDKRLSIDLESLRQLLWVTPEEEELDELPEDHPDVIHWIDTSIMLVDAMTKDMKTEDLRSCLQKAAWSLEPTAESQVTKMAKQKYRKMVAEEKQRLKAEEAEEAELRAGPEET